MFYPNVARSLERQFAWLLDRLSIFYLNAACSLERQFACLLACMPACLITYSSFIQMSLTHWNVNLLACLLAWSLVLLLSALCTLACTRPFSKFGCYSLWHTPIFSLVHLQVVALYWFWVHGIWLCDLFLHHLKNRCEGSGLNPSVSS